MNKLGALLALTLGLTSLGVVTATPAVAAPPDNDALANAIAVGEGSTTTTTAEATDEDGDNALLPDECPVAHSVWFTYTAGAEDDALTVATTLDAESDPDLDTVLAVYTSDTETPTFDSLHLVRCNDEGGDGHLSSMQLRITPETTYVIQVADYVGPGAGASQSPLLLNVSADARPANDDVGGAQALDPGTPGTGSTEFATLQEGEAGKSCGAIEDSIWFRWTAGTATRADVEVTELDLGLSTAVNVYKASSPTDQLSDLQRVGCGETNVSFPTTADTTYYVQVSDAGQIRHGPPGSRRVLITTGVVPANDKFLDAAMVTSPDLEHVDNSFATLQGGEPQPECASDNVSRSVWYKFTAPADGTVLIETLDPEQVDTVLAVYTGLTIGTLEEKACDDDAGPGFLSKLTLSANSGTTYFVQVGTLGAKGTFDLHLASGTTTSLTVGATGQTVDLRATVAAVSGTPTGTVEFQEGGQTRGQSAVVSGVATLSLPSVSVGSHTYKAVFTPTDADFTSSTSSTQTVTVTAPPSPLAATTTTITAPDKVFAGRRATVRVLVTTATGAPAQGTVTITIGNRTRTVPLVNGRAVLKSSRLRKTGKVVVTASYAATATTLASSDSDKIKVRNRPRPGR
jgi:hypothetical protein